MESCVAVTASATTKNNVVERIRVGVQQGVQETKSRLLGPQTCVIEEGDDTTESRSGAGGTLVSLERTLIVNLNRVSLCLACSL